MTTAYRAAVGCNLGPDDRRFDPGDRIPASLVPAGWVDQGLVVVDTTDSTGTPRPSRRRTTIEGGD